MKNQKKFNEIPCKVILDGECILDGEIWEARRLPQIQSMLPKDWKSPNDKRREKRIQEVSDIETGTRLQTASLVYEGDLLWNDPTHELHHQRPVALRNVQFEDPITICFSRLNPMDPMDYQGSGVWMVVERNQVETFVVNTHLSAKIPHHLHARPKGMVCSMQGRWVVARQGRQIALFGLERLKIYFSPCF